MSPLVEKPHNTDTRQILRESFHVSVQRKRSAVVLPMNMDGETTNHRLVLNPGNVKRNCVYCRQMGFRFACGNSKTSYYRCEECQVSLCRISSENCNQTNLRIRLNEQSLHPSCRLCQMALSDTIILNLDIVKRCVSSVGKQVLVLHVEKFDLRTTDVTCASWLSVALASVIVFFSGIKD